MRKREVLYCELCGAPIEGRAYRITVEGIELIVCERCYRNYISRTKRFPAIPSSATGQVDTRSPLRQQRRVAPPQKSWKPATPPSLPVPRVKPKRRIDEKTVERYEVVADYALRVKRARERLGLSQRELAQRVKESERVIRRIEAGTLRPTVDLAKRLEKVLGIKLLEPVVEGEPVTSGGKEEYLTLGDIAEIRG